MFKKEHLRWYPAHPQEILFMK